MHGRIKALLALFVCAFTYSGTVAGAASLYLDGHAAQTGSTSVIWSLSETYDETTSPRATIVASKDGLISATLTGGNNIQVFSLGIRTPTGTELVPGLYAGAVQSGGDATGHLPSLNASGQGIGCINTTGWFRVIEADFAADGTPVKVAVDFLAWCDGIDSPLFGAIRIGSAVAAPSRDTHAVAGRRITADQGQSVKLDASWSASISNAPLSYAWTQTAGPAVQLAAANTATPTFTAPNVTPGGQTLTFQLTVTGAASEVDTDTISVLVHHPSDLQTRALLFSPIGEPLLEPHRRYYSPDPQNDDVQDFRYVFNADDWLITGKMRGSSDLLLKLQGAFPILKGHHNGLNVEAATQLELQKGQNVPLTVGRYEAAQFFDPNATTVPYLRFSGPEGSCDEIGAFDVREIEFPPPSGPATEGQVTKLAVDFERRCFLGSDVSVPIRGSIRINSAIPLADDLSPPLPPPAPTTVQFTISPNPVVVGQEATLSWSSTNAAYCYGNNGFNGVARDGPLATAGSIKQTWTAEVEQDIFVTCYTSNSANTDVETLRVVAANPGPPPGSGGGSSGGGGGGGGPIDGLMLAFAALALAVRRRL